MKSYVEKECRAIEREMKRPNGRYEMHSNRILNRLLLIVVCLVLIQADVWGCENCHPTLLPAQQVGWWGATWTCECCGYENYKRFNSCWNCGAEAALMRPDPRGSI